MIVLSGYISEETGSTADITEAMLQSNTATLAEHPTVAIYEQLLRVFHQNPTKLKGISDMLRHLDPDVVGDEFLEMYSAFDEAAKKVKK